MTNILLIKWGRPSDAFVSTPEAMMHKGRGGDGITEFVAQMYAEHSKVYLWLEGKRGKIDITLPSNLEVFNNNSLHHYNLKFEKIVIITGPNDAAYNNKFIAYLKTKCKNIPIIAYANDRRFLRLEGLEGMNIKMSTELLKDKGEWQANMGFLPAYTRFEIERQKSNNIICFINENYDSLATSRVRRLVAFAKANPHLTFDVRGRFESQDNIKALTNEPNIAFTNTQYDLAKMYKVMRRHKYALVLLSKDSATRDDELDKLTGYPTNHACLKYYEYATNDVIPIVDFGYDEFKVRIDSFYHKLITILPGDDLSKLTDIVVDMKDYRRLIQVKYYLASQLAYPSLHAFAWPIM